MEVLVHMIKRVIPRSAVEHGLSQYIFATVRVAVWKKAIESLAAMARTYKVQIRYEFPICIDLKPHWI
jgi:hypothetical protein